MYCEIHQEYHFGKGQELCPYHGSTTTHGHGTSGICIQNGCYTIHRPDGPQTEEECLTGWRRADDPPRHFVKLSCGHIDAVYVNPKRAPGPLQRLVWTVAGLRPIRFSFFNTLQQGTWQSCLKVFFGHRSIRLTGFWFKGTEPPI